MNAESMNYVTDPASITKLARDIIQNRAQEDAGRATYLRSLLAGIQIEIAGKPVLRAQRGRQARPELPAVMAALEKVNTAFYEAVLAAIPNDLTPEERNAKSSFARSAVSTLRRALRLGWNVLTPLADVTKYGLTKWGDENAPQANLSPARVERRVEGCVQRIANLLQELPEPDASKLLKHVLAELGGLGSIAAAAPQRITATRLRREPARPTAH